MKLSLAKVKNLKKRYIVLIIIGLLIVFSIVRNVFKEDDSKEFFTVERGAVSETITLAGTIDMKDRVNLGFGTSGRVSQVYATKGKSVKKGDVLARLSTNQLLSQLLEAEANLKQVRAESVASSVSFEYSHQNLLTTKQQQDVLVESAYRSLLSRSLEAYSEKDVEEPAPTISGTYTGEEGNYYIKIYPSASASGYSFKYSGLEEGFSPVQTNLPAALGTKGLYIRFQEGYFYGTNNEWIVSIPNTRSSDYLSRKSTYDQAVSERARVVASVEDLYLQANARESSGIVSKSQAEVLAAEARVSAIRAQMEDGVIRAPFDGVVGTVNTVVGEIVTANSPYITLVGSEQFELSLDVPEIDVAKLEIGDEVFITLDAYLNQGDWKGEIQSIDIIDTLVDGVPVYKTTVVINNPDDRIRVGMGAKASILAQEKENILKAPQYFFERTENGYETRVLIGEKKEDDLNVRLGLVGSDGFVEIISGLTEGDVLIRNKTLQ